MQIVVIIEVQHLEHEACFDNWRFLEQRHVKLLNELVKVQSAIHLAIRQNRVKTRIQKGRFVAEILLKVQFQRVFGHVTL